VYTEYVNGIWGYGTLEIHNITHLEWKFLSDLNDTLVDTMWIVR
jgi:hypothetical protein